MKIANLHLMFYICDKDVKAYKIYENSIKT
jgi:hypothetical protein